MYGAVDVSIVLNPPKVSPIKKLWAFGQDLYVLLRFLSALDGFWAGLQLARCERYEHVKHRRKAGAWRRRRHLPAGDVRRSETERGGGIIGELLYFLKSAHIIGLVQGRPRQPISNTITLLATLNKLCYRRYSSSPPNIL